jgi:hypothetical protein
MPQATAEATTTVLLLLLLKLQLLHAWLRCSPVAATEHRTML